MTATYDPLECLGKIYIDHSTGEYVIDARQPGDVGWGGGRCTDLEDGTRWLQEIIEEGHK